MGKPGRPATGQKTVKTFRPPDWLWADFEARYTAAGLSQTDALVEAVEDWNRKQDRRAARRRAQEPNEEPTP